MNIKQGIQYQTLTELLIDKEEEYEQGIAFIYSQKEEIHYSYSTLYKNALFLLGYLQQQGLEYQDKLVFQLKKNEEFIFTFWACILGGIIPVPIVADDKEEYRTKLFHVVQSLDNAWIIGKTDTIHPLTEFAKAHSYHARFLENQFLSIDQALLYEKPGEVFPVSQEDIALIQFSSGSTGQPKGVVLTHRNLLVNMEAIIEGAGLSSEDVIVSWMPLTHDMGLIGCHLATTAVNMQQYSMNTTLFVRKPQLWLEKLTEHQATIITSPNFGLQYSIKALERSSHNQYDFSAIRIIINGAEPISIKICEEFLKKTSIYGMKGNVMFPVYGMAEASLAIAFPRLSEEKIHTSIVDRRSLKLGNKVTYLTEEGITNAVCFAEEGYPVKHCQIRICNEQDQRMEEDTLGIIQIKGENVTKGYYRNEMANDKVFTKDGWLRTGDIGFFHEGRLVVVGRMQEVIIVNGQNYFSHDLERIASEVEMVDENKVVVTSFIDKETQVEKVVVAIVHRGSVERFLPFIHSIRSQFAKSCGIFIDYIIPVKSIPKTSSGKPMRFKIRESMENGEYKESIRQTQLLQQSSMQQDKDKNSLSYDQQVEQQILAICHEVAPDLQIGINDGFFETGIHSLLLNQLSARLEEAFSIKLSNQIFFEYSTIKKLATYIVRGEERVAATFEEKSEDSIPVKNGDIAIIGMAAVVPGAANINEFWNNLCGGVESVGPISTSRKKDIEDYLHQAELVKGEIESDAGYLYEMDKFDYSFFKILKREAVAMSPAQRLFLQTAYTSLEDAGYGGDALKSSKTGVFVGYIGDLDGHQYQQIVQHSKDSLTPTGILSANISGRLSYFMDFKGPSLNVDSACSSSMSALYLAAKAIWNNDCDQAVVGGVELKVLPLKKSKKAGIESSDGHTRPFSEQADGTGFGEGVVSILIKRYDKAIQDKDHIYGVIRGISSNQDGKSIGLSAPNPEAQTALVLDALKKASMKAEDITYVEAHGTGTKLGDPIEINALTKAFQVEGKKKQTCAIGSVKANIGHLYAASGLISIVKVCLMLKNKQIPATINIQSLNQAINFPHTPFYVNREFKNWETDNKPRICGISNFGFSGTNCHTIIQEYIDGTPDRGREEEYPFILSAPSKEELEYLIKSYYRYLKQHYTLNLGDISFTTAVGRNHFPYRAAFIVKNVKELIKKLEQYEFTISPANHRYVGMIKMVQVVSSKRKWIERSIGEMDYLSEVSRKEILSYFNKPDKKERIQLLEKLCTLYVRGAKPVWGDLYQSDIRRVSLPTSKYKETRCWPEI